MPDVASAVGLPERGVLGWAGRRLDRHPGDRSLMRWTAAAARDAANVTLEKRLWAAADQLRANSGLNAAQYSQPVLGLIFLRFAEVRFAARRKALVKHAASNRRGSRLHEPSAYQVEGVLYLVPNARFDFVLANQL